MSENSVELKCHTRKELFGALLQRIENDKSHDWCENGQPLQRGDRLFVRRL